MEPDKAQPGDIISYLEMCQLEGNTSLQRGMNYRLHHNVSVVLMSQRRGAPYEDRVEENGKILIYEGHDVPKSSAVTNPKEQDQQAATASGTPTQNGLFFQAAKHSKQKKQTPELVRVYEKIKQSIWVYNGLFQLIDAWQEKSGPRKVFKFKLELTDKDFEIKKEQQPTQLPHERLIPSSIKLEVWKRDGGRCVICGNDQNLHFDHIIPFSRGGSSLVADNIQLLCAKHNLLKRDKIQ
ncbi:MAG: HNH endonuclease [Desulfarculaceae bacterium]|nr:HNH endonuclease [Desulfarculaceae bacterium]MCF8071268.1 HNH endonuclease [Desulfarculaceae bacterium]MCF8101129.1 HNH endonuclease [Desulfarculaceae bacterium]MCF8115322.1 HNH endonuclease [Desulfarculaceae bacterium]